MTPTNLPSPTPENTVPASAATKTTLPACLTNPSQEPGTAGPSFGRVFLRCWWSAGAFGGGNCAKRPMQRPPIPRKPLRAGTLR